MSSVEQVVSTKRAPAAIGPYSQAIIADGLVYTSGQIPLDPESGAVVEGGIAEQTRQALENLTHVLEAAGSSMDCVVRTTCYLVDLDEFGAFNDVYGTFFPNDPPARSTVQVARLPRDVRVEIDCVAMVVRQDQSGS
jgi:2-iminobutanoate/2-iminopropanoate deaminase